MNHHQNWCQGWNSSAVASVLTASVSATVQDYADFLLVYF
jgi:hypothetical protein